MYALVEYKGKQYKAEKGAVLSVDKLDAEKGAKIDVDTVLLVSDGDKISVGAPYVKGAKVQIVVEDSFRDKKVLVFKYKSKKDYHRLIGHRQNYTNVRVEDIVIA
ncbi:MAG: 50S ribosomal protein L21 [Treponema porcinum]|uniref:Large ribosomal subunit protein bL21 n=2 Tax=Treponema porcinum TaxID=261392 RepID=A0A1T4JKX4_TREPO|nr:MULTISPECIES: 50S ribosomal protein L21 [Treponema]MCI5645109.1 50S ribosomal protein L21 [Treponema porcinum]MCI6179827.1 50S ribosomal protein L21 [Treponema porcinum]MCI6481708.1 50S ribosomal protein L21 [Treponema porcinum]MCI6722220.1 50S ribosomal protein L21 [Treponema porcinum]MCI6816338.1 50S ribosomal protein L21 [Treponema porcinum]